jgi:hypothetical protein
MADKVGMKREWFQNKTHFPHYDLQPAKRKLAVKYGAIEVDCADRVAQMRAERKAKQNAGNSTSG